MEEMGMNLRKHAANLRNQLKFARCSILEVESRCPVGRLVLGYCTRCAFAGHEFVIARSFGEA
jgi:hypothetical protein